MLYLLSPSAAFFWDHFPSSTMLTGAMSLAVAPVFWGLLDSILFPPMQSSGPTPLFSSSVAPCVPFPLFPLVSRSSVLISVVPWSSVFFRSPVASLLPWAPSPARPSFAGWHLRCFPYYSDISSLLSGCMALTVLIFKCMVYTCPNIPSVSRTPCFCFVPFFLLRCRLWPYPPLRVVLLILGCVYPPTALKGLL